MSSTRHQELERRFRELLAGAGLRAPDESAHLGRALVFLWYEAKAFVLVDLQELPVDEDPFEGLDLEALRLDIEGDPLGPIPGPLPPPGFAEAG